MGYILMDKTLVLFTFAVVIITTLIGAEFFIKSEELNIENSPRYIVSRQNTTNGDTSDSRHVDIDSSIIANASELSNNKNSVIPVLMYHAIGKGINDLYLDVYHFEQHISNLKNENYNFITFEDLKSGNVPLKPIIITFDDGYDNLYKNAYPILKKYNVTATIFLISGSIDKDGYLNTQQIKEMNDLISFQSHTVSHPDLKKISLERLDFEAKKSKETIKLLVKNEVIAYCYPSGKYNKNTIDVAKKYYNYGVTINYGLYHLNNDPYLISRIRINHGDSGAKFSEKLKKLGL